jgi:hypothetical protein
VSRTQTTSCPLPGVLGTRREKLWSRSVRAPRPRKGQNLQPLWSASRVMPVSAKGRGFVRDRNVSAHPAGAQVSRPTIGAPESETR